MINKKNSPIIKMRSNLISLQDAHPQIAAEWHPTLNGDLTPNQISRAGDFYIWWQCPNDPSHIYQSPPSNRTRKKIDKNGNLVYKNGCPYCSNTKVCRTNCLETTYPEIIQFWDYSKNTITPQEVTRGSEKVVWWVCPEGHSYKKRICDMKQISPNSKGCPFCHSSKGQRRLFDIVVDQFPEYNIEFDYRKSGLRFSKTNFPIELDIYVPKLKLAFEYHGLQHFEEIKSGYFSSSLEEIQSNDKEKLELTKSAGIYLIVVDYKWDLSEDLIINEIEKFFLNPEW